MHALNLDYEGRSQRPWQWVRELQELWKNEPGSTSVCNKEGERVVYLEFQSWSILGGMETLFWKNLWGEPGRHLACKLMSEPMQEVSQPWPKGFRENRVFGGEGFPWGESMSNKRRDYLRKEDTEGFPRSTQITKRTQQSVENQWFEKNLRECLFIYNTGNKGELLSKNPNPLVYLKLFLGTKGDFSQRCKDVTTSVKSIDVK